MMHPSALLPRIVSSLYYSVWPRIRPNGYLGNLIRASGRRAGCEWHSPEDVRLRQLGKLNALLTHAASRVPYYRRLSARGRFPSRLDRLEELRSVPELTRETVRTEGKNLLSEGYPEERLRKLATGGSTGQPLHFYSDEDALVCKNAAESWSSGMVGLHRGSSIALLWGAGSFEPSSRQSLREGLGRLLTNRLFIDCFRMSEPDLVEAHRRLDRFRPEGLLGYTSALVELAEFLRRRGIRPRYPTKAVISAAEALDPPRREQLREVFGDAVYDRYGSREIGLIAVECRRHEGLHVDCENVLVELVEDPQVRPLRRILVTKLTQYSMPFIRYDIGDLAEGPMRPCPCGRGYPLLPRVVGRVTEMIRKPDGSALPGELFPHLLKDCGVASYQVTQAEDYSVDVALVAQPEQTAEQDALLRKVVNERLGPDVPVRFRYVDCIERSRTGKLLPVVSRAPKRPRLQDRAGDGLAPHGKAES